MISLSIKNYNKFHKIITSLKEELGRIPLAEEVACELGYNIGKITLEEVGEWLAFILDDENTEIEEKTEDDFELSIKYSMKNYEMQKLRIKKGLKLEELSELIGEHNQTAGRIESCRLYPTEQIQNKIADVLGSTREKIFPEWLVYFETAQKEKRNIKIVPIKNLQIDAPEILELSDGTDLYQEAERSVLRDKVFNALSILKPKDRRIIELSFGLVDGIQRTLEEVGKEFGISRERVRQILAKAQEQLRQNDKLQVLKKP